MDRAAILRRVDALLAKTVANGATGPEAAAAQSKVRELLRKYDVSPSGEMAAPLFNVDDLWFGEFIKAFIIGLWVWGSCGLRPDFVSIGYLAYIVAGILFYGWIGYLAITLVSALLR